jgi:transcriptional regulator with XRE-family HTH domain
MRYSQKYVVSLLDLGEGGMLSRYEQGYLLPPLALALRLAVVYRVPVDFLFRDLYEEYRAEIRIKEAIMRGGAQQGVLF